LGFLFAYNNLLCLNTHVKSFIRHVFNRSFWGLFCVGLLILWNINLSIYNTTLKTSAPKSFHVIDERRSQYTTYFTVWDGEGLWEIDNPNLKVGSEYRGVFTSKQYFISSENSFEKYLRSQGIQGELKSEKTLEVNQKCDWLCSVFTIIKKNQNYAYLTATKFTCHEGYAMIKQLYYSEVSCADVASLITGLTYGDVSGMSKDTKEVMRKFGLTHLVAVSGFQVVLLSSILEMFFLSLKIKFRSRLFLILVSLFGMAIFTGLQAPIIRAFLSAMILLIARFTGRRCSQLRALIFSGGLMLIINPLYIFSISFQLSFAATFALLRTNFSTKFANIIWAPINAFLYTLPIIISFTSSVSPTGIITNILVAPFVSVVTYFSLIGFIPWVGDLFLIIVNIIIVLFLNLLNELSKYVELVEFGKMNIIEMGLYYIVLFTFGVMMQKYFPKRVVGTEQKNILANAYLS
jgi:ComEC/Rec2-related protein